MNIVIIEDEQLAAEKLTDFVKRHDSNYKVLTVLQSVREALDWFGNNETPDLLFSDIELLDGNVFSFYKQKKITCPIIFTTAYDQFLQKAFDENGIAYLLKPFDYNQFSKAIQKYEELKNNFSPFDDKFFKQFKNSFTQERTYKKRFTVKTPRGIFILKVEDIAFIKAEEGLVFSFLSDGKRHTLNFSLTELEQMLDPQLFFRPNRSEIINIHFIEKMENYFNDRLSVKLKGFDEQIVASASRTPALRKWVDN